jgi:signal transduction histidine kinase
VLDDFAYAMSHDLRAPLRHVVGFVEVLADLDSVRADPEAASICDRLREAGRKLDTMTLALGDLLRLGSPSLRVARVSPGAEASAIIRSLGATAVRWEMEPLPDVEGDPVLVRQAMRELLTNAVKASAGRPEPRIRISGERAGGDLWLTVADNGIGFAPPALPRLFTPFGKAHSSSEFEGVGMGLARVRRIAELHRGAVDAEGTAGQGARFRLRLPLAGQPPRTVASLPG